MTILSTWSLVVQEAKYHFWFMAQYATLRVYTKNSHLVG